jgi:glyoxylase-like metal-dependent hydrolase (beta-lactamase superfamily II)
MHEILSGISSWPWFSERHGYDFNGYLVQDPGGAICIDPVEPNAEDMAVLERSRPACIVITNRNHTRAANTVRERTGARVVIHPSDAAYARQQGVLLDGEATTGSRIGPFVVVAVPGKSPGEIALHDAARRVLVVGDAVIGNPPGQCSLLSERVMDDPARLRASLHSLLALDFDTLLVGDGTPIIGGAKEKLGELVSTFPS